MELLFISGKSTTFSILVQILPTATILRQSELNKKIYFTSKLKILKLDTWQKTIRKLCQKNSSSCTLSILRRFPLSLLLITVFFRRGTSPDFSQIKFYHSAAQKTTSSVVLLKKFFPIFKSKYSSTLPIPLIDGEREMEKMC